MFEDRYELPPVEDVTDDPGTIASKQARVRDLALREDAIILAHNYQRPEVQDVADLVGDSLGLSRAAASSGASTILFCGVHFMAETAAILCPDKRVLLPTLQGGCSLASSIRVEELRAWKARYPDAVTVAYVNTSAEIKAEVDVCCTSANAAQVVLSVDPARPILFLPDRFLAQVVAAVTKRENIIAYPGDCHVHRLIDPEYVELLLRENPQMELLLHPECGCVSSCMQRTVEGTLPRERVHFLSTEGMLRHVDASPADMFAVGTEVGILHRLRRGHPGRRFVPVNDEAVCAFMKSVTLDSMIQCLESGAPHVRVPPDLADRARRPIERMCAIQ